MRFDEPDTREAYRRGARDLFECVAGALTPNELRVLEAWFEEVENWQEFDPPHPPTPFLR